MAFKPKYCSQCGSAALQSQIPDGDNLPREVCQNCHFIFYLNPKIVVGAVVTFNDLYLLCKRDIEPQRGFWTYPAGYLEENETLEEGAIRETFEESKAQVEINRLVGIYSLKRVNQVHIIYSATMLTKQFETTFESSEVQLIKAQDIPWEHLAFPVIKWALKAHLDSAMHNQVDIKSTSLSLADSLKYD